VGSIINLLDLAHGTMKLIEVTLTAMAPAVAGEKTLDELSLSDAIRVVAVVRAEQPMVPQGSMRFLEHDHVILLARAENAHDCAHAFIG
jgi:hypothetical protein